MKNNPQYHEDFCEWTFHTANLLRQGKYEEVDIENVAKKIEGLARRDKHQSIEKLIEVISLLLKWQLQPKKQTRRLDLRILNLRIKLSFILNDSPLLTNKMSEMLNELYQSAVNELVTSTHLSAGDFPEKCPYSLKQCLDYRYLPE